MNTLIITIYHPAETDSHGHISTTSGSSNGDKISNNSSTMTSGSAKTDTSDSDNDVDFGKASPRPHRKRKTKSSSKSRHHSSGSSNNGNHGGAANSGSGAANGGAAGGSADSRTASLLAQADNDDELAYVDTLPEEVKLVEVNSNIWGTKFKIHGIAKNLPANLGQISYKTSLLHLQPRQMTVVVTELRDDLRPEPDPNFNPHIFSEDEDESALAVASPPPRTPPPGQSNTVASALLASYTPDLTTAPGDDADDSAALPVTSRLHSMPRPNRLLSARGSPSHSAGKSTPLGPLAKAESYEDDAFQSENATAAVDLPTSSPASSHKLFTTNASRPTGPSYSSLVSQYSRSSSNSSGQSSSRHAISPLCNDGSVPTLQSPKNAVAPNDIIFDRPPPSGLHSLSGSGAGTGSGDSAATNVMVVKSHHSTAPPAAAATSSTSTRKRGDLQYIDEDAGATASGSTLTAAAVVEPMMHRTPTIISIAPTAIVRSCSVGYLDTVEIIPSDVTLSILRKEAPHKRLVLIDRKPTAIPSGNGGSISGNSSKSKSAAATRRPYRKKLLIECGKSKSLDSCDLQKVFAAKADINDEEKSNEVMTMLLPPPMPKVHEASETEDSSSDIETGSNGVGSSSQLGSDRDFLIVTYAPPSPGMSASVKNRQPAKSQPFCIKCKIMSRECQCKISRKNQANDAVDLKLAVRAKKENVTSFADSPLFTRKHRFGEGSSRSDQANARSPSMSKKHEFSFSFLKQLSEVRRRKRDDQAGADLEEREVQEQIDVNTKDGKDGERPGFTSLHSQALSTLENIISRLKDLEDNTRNGSNADMPAALEVRQPRSSPASPAPGKKKRNPSSSPIRQILNSPLLNRRNRKKQLIESSDEETPLYPNADDKQELAAGSGGTKKDKQPYQDLETFQKAQLRQKVMGFLYQIDYS